MDDGIQNDTPIDGYRDCQTDRHKDAERDSEAERHIEICLTPP